MLRMYTLCLAGIVGLGLGATGCGGGGGHAGGNFDAIWSLALAGDGAVSCAGAGVTEVDLDVLDTFTGIDYHDKFACSAYGGTSERLPADDYTVALRAYDASNALVSEMVFPDVYSILPGSVTPLPSIVFVVQ